MKLMRRWEEFMGPKDERIENRLGHIYRIGYAIFVIGTTACLYYGLMLNQVADVTDRPILTPLGQTLVSPNILLIIVLLIAGIVPTAMMIRDGIVSERTRIARVDRVPWNYVVSVSALMGVLVGIGCFALRVIAEIQIAGIQNVMWGGDIAIGVVFGSMIFVVAVIELSSSIASAIKRRKAIEHELGD